MNKVMFFFVLTSFVYALEPPDACMQFNWDKLNAKAAGKVDVNLQGSMLQMASRFLAGKGDEAKIKELVQGLKCVYVKSFTFDKEGQYSDADLNELRSHVQGADWSKIVDVQEKHEISAIYLKTDGKQSQGIVVMTAGPKELTVVQIIGPIDPAMLSDLGGKMGIPKIDLDSKKKTAPSKKDDDD
jgi:Domain of unknown function (DUF4252)